MERSAGGARRGCLCHGGCGAATAAAGPIVRGCWSVKHPTLACLRRARAVRTRSAYKDASSGNIAAVSESARVGQHPADRWAQLGACMGGLRASLRRAASQRTQGCRAYL